MAASGNMNSGVVPSEKAHQAKSTKLRDNDAVLKTWKSFSSSSPESSSQAAPSLAGVSLSSSSPLLRVALSSPSCLAAAQENVTTLPVVSVTQVNDVPVLQRPQDRYELERVIGQGAYGTVWLAVDRQDGRRVAVKRIPNVFGDIKESKRTLREVRILKHLRHASPYIIKMQDIFVTGLDPRGREPTNHTNFTDLFVVTEYMDGGDLSRLCNNSLPDWKALSENQVKDIAFKILSGLRTMHSAKVLHRDLRPKNILLGNNVIKIADFGMGRGERNYKTPKAIKLSLMEFVSSRYYTAPEGLLPNNEYDYPVDVWAVGCIIVELLLGYNVFKDSRFPDQLRTVINVIGTPTEEDIASIANGRNERFRVYLRTIHAQEPDRLWTLLPNLSPQGKHFLGRLLAFAPTKRATAEEALRHPWLQNVARPPEAEGRLVAPFDASDIDATEEELELRRLLWEEVERFHEFPRQAKRK